MSYHWNITGVYNSKIQVVCITVRTDCFGVLCSDECLRTSCSRRHTICSSYPCPLQFFTSNDQVWSASRIDAATASPVVRAKRTNPRNSSCMLQLSSTNRIDMQSCSIFETSGFIGENREERCMLWNLNDNFVP